MYQTVIKYSGSKRLLAKEIINYFPKKINTYYEPFCGSASILRRLLDNNIQVNNYYCSDINRSLIELFNIIKDKPEIIIEHYKKLWIEFNSKDYNYRKKFFNEIREKYNKERNPLDYLFLTRVATNGMSRFNSKGEFNTSCHFSRPGIEPSKLDNIIKEWNIVLKKHNVKFECLSYENIIP